MTFAAQMRVGTLEMTAALIVVAVAAARPYLLRSLHDETSPFIVRLRIFERGQNRTLEAPCPLVIGRSAAAGLVLDDAEVSREHVRFEAHRGVLYASDLESRNGTFLNGRPLRESVELRAGDEIDVGTTRVLVEDIRRWT